MMNIKEKQTRERIVSDMEQLLTHKAEEGLVWRSTKTDLMEMVHYLFYADVIRDEQGLPVTFTELVRRTCEILHMEPPSNPNHLVARAMMRKGRKMLPLLQRYEGISLYTNLYTTLYT